MCVATLVLFIRKRVTPANRSKVACHVLSMQTKQGIVKCYFYEHRRINNLLGLFSFFFFYNLGIAVPS